MSLNALYQQASSVFPEHEGFWTPFYDASTELLLKRGQVVKPAGQTEQALYYLLEGVWGSFLNHVSHDRCLDLAGQHEFMADYSSLLRQQPTPLQVVSLTASRVLMVRHDRLMQLYASPAGNQIRTMVAEQLLHDRQQQLLDLHTLTASERYLQLLQQRPDLVLQTPQKHLASYLGIVPESLSRIRRQVMQQAKS